MTRRPHIDWLRGLAVAVMIEAHSVDSWTRAADKARPAYGLLAFIAGWAAPLFLFLAGLSVALAGASHQRKGATLREAGWAVQKRGWQIFGLAYVFRVYLFVLGPGQPWTSILKPDILNVLGLGIVLAAWCWSRAAETPRRMIWLAAPAIVALTLAPFATVWHWPSLLPDRLEAYIRPNGRGTFSLLPWIAFVPLGAMLGTVLAPARDASTDARFQLKLGVAGALVLAAGYAGSFLPAPLPHSSFWTTSISWVVIRTGAMTAMLPLAWLWCRRPTAHHWSPMVLFGRTSLFVYWVHVELAYGFWTAPLRGRLTIAEWGVAYVVFSALMAGAAVVWVRWRARSGPGTLASHAGRARRGIGRVPSAFTPEA